MYQTEAFFIGRFWLLLVLFADCINEVKQQSLLKRSSLTTTLSCALTVLKYCDKPQNRTEMKKDLKATTSLVSRRRFMQSMGIAAAALGLPRAYAAQKAIPGLENAPKDPNASKGWKPVSDRKIRFGIVGHG